MHHFVMQNPQVNGEGGGTKQASVGGIIKGRWHGHTMLGGHTVGGWWGMKRGGM